MLPPIPVGLVVVVVVVPVPIAYENSTNQIKIGMPGWLSHVVTYGPVESDITTGLLRLQNRIMYEVYPT